MIRHTLVLVLVCGVPAAGALALLLLPRRGAALAGRIAGVCAAATMGMAVVLWWRAPEGLGVDGASLRLMVFVAATACVAVALAWRARRVRLKAWAVLLFAVEASVLGTLVAATDHTVHADGPRIMHGATAPASQANCDKPAPAVTLPATHGDTPLNLMAFASCGGDHPAKPASAPAKR